MKPLLRYSTWDGFPVTTTIFQLILNVWLATTWEAHNISQILLIFPICLFLFWYNALVATHNFVHTPWFSSKVLNQVYAVLNSVNLGSPVTHYRHLHLNHHRYGNDRQDAKGHTQDGSSTFAYGKHSRSEHVISYCGLAILRDDVTETLREARTHNEVTQLWLELGACVLAMIGYLLISWKFFVFFALPVFYWGWFLTYFANYYEHFGADPDERYGNSASYYGRIYNALFCNEGYHQEHHLRPNTHWSQRPIVRQALRHKLDRVDRVILKFPPPLGFLHHQGKTDTSVQKLIVR